MRLAEPHRLPATPGLHEADGGLTHLAFGLLRLDEGEERTVPLASREAVLVVLEGEPGATVGGKPFALKPRRSVFEDAPSALYAPPGSALVVRGPVIAGIFFSPAPADETLVPFVVSGDEPVERGRGNFHRRVRDLITPEHHTARLLVGETLNPPGNWSSAPPHKHDRSDPPHEAELEEIYCFRVSPATGFGLQHSYTTEPPAERTFAVHDLDVVTIPAGYHPVVACPGHELYYLWGLAGEGRALRWQTDPRHRFAETDPFGTTQ